jgi:hypothetical protein
MADIFEIVVFAARPNAFLRAGGPGIPAHFLTQEEALELDHARIGEQQGGVVPRNEGRTPYDFVALVSKIVEKFLPNVSKIHPLIQS